MGKCQCHALEQEPNTCQYSDYTLQKRLSFFVPSLSGVTRAWSKEGQLFCRLYIKGTSETISWILQPYNTLGSPQTSNYATTPSDQC